MQSAFILGSAILLLNEAIEDLLNPQIISEVKAGYIVMLISIFLKRALVMFQR
jgi:divalent metal cation (Fe/Co/Zn/Cd) transporter